MLLKKISFFIVLFLAGFALFGVIPVSYNTFTNQNPCPYLFNIIPACYIVTIGYSLVLLSLFIKKKKIFYIGWLPVFLLAITGSVSELLGHEVCPKNTAGIPLCYYSLLLSCLVLVFFLIHNRSIENK